MKSNKKLQGLTIFKNYKIQRKIGSGAFGEIYLVNHKEELQQKYAMKIQPITSRHPQLKQQAKLYRQLNQQGSIEGIPKIYAIGLQAGYNLMLMDLLGQSLQDLFVKKNKKLSVKTVIQIGQQLIDRIEYFHSKNFLHRDIKPDNMLIGTANKAHIIFLIDYGLAKKYKRQGKHIPYVGGKDLTGTARYASINTHKGFQQSRRDDIQSIGYSLLYFLRGILPWQNMVAKDVNQKYKLIMQKKINTPIKSLCQGFPEQFGTIIRYARQLKFDEKPDYKYLKELLSTLRQKLGYQRDFVYDWSN